MTIETKALPTNSVGSLANDGTTQCCHVVDDDEDDAKVAHFDTMKMTSL